MATGGVLEVRLSGAGAAWGPVCDDRFDQNGNQVRASVALPLCAAARPLYIGFTEMIGASLFLGRRCDRTLRAGRGGLPPARLPHAGGRGLRRRHGVVQGRASTELQPGEAGRLRGGLHARPAGVLRRAPVRRLHVQPADVRGRPLVPQGPGPPGAVGRPQRFPQEIHSLRWSGVGARGAYQSKMAFSGPGSARGCSTSRSPASGCSGRTARCTAGLGRIVALHHRSSPLQQAHSTIPRIYS